MGGRQSHWTDSPHILITQYSGGVVYAVQSQKKASGQRIDNHAVFLADLSHVYFLAGRNTYETHSDGDD